MADKKTVTPIGRAKKRRPALSYSATAQRRLSRSREERALLHVMATSSDGWDAAVLAGIGPSDFTSMAHRLVAEGLFALIQSGRTPDAMALAEWADDQGHVRAERISFSDLTECFGQDHATIASTMEPAKEGRRLAIQVRRASLLRDMLAAVSFLVNEEDEQKIDSQVASVRDAVVEYSKPPGVPPAVARALQYNAGKAWPPPATPHNVTTILRHDRRVIEDEDGLWFDERTRRPMLGRAELTDRREARFRSRLSTLYRLTASQTDVRAAVDVVATENPRNPLVERLRALAPTWDGTRRAHLWLAETFGTPPGPLVEHAAGSSGLYHVYAYRWMLAGVARAFAPGCKVDNMLVLVGRQGQKKGFALHILAGADAIGRDLGGNLQLDLRHPRDCEQQMAALWICEVAELASLLRTDYDTVKDFVTTRDARHVMKYERHVTMLPRASILAGTSNDNELFRDPTGDRRFWAVPTPAEANLPWLRANRDQLWAEVAAAYLGGERQWYLTDEEDRAQRADVENYSRHNATTEILRDALTGIDSVSVNDLYRRFLQYTPDQAPRHEKQVAASMQALGYRRHGAKYSR